MKITGLKTLFTLTLAVLPVFTLTNHLSAQEVWIKLLRHGVVNQIELEEYVCGVLAGEISSSCLTCDTVFCPDLDFTLFEKEIEIDFGHKW